MKRLLGIILLGILFVNQSNSLTIKQIDQDNKTIGYFDNDDLKDYIVREKKNLKKWFIQYLLIMVRATQRK